MRSAWISFTGRIVAQILGAAATVGFALIVFQREPAAHIDTAQVVAPTAIPLTGAQVARPIVVVLPFQTYAATAEHNHIAGAMTDLLLTELAQTKDFEVTSATSAMRYQGASATVPEIGRQLGVSHVVEGSVAIAGGRARVIAQLIDAASDQHVWARSYETTIDDALKVESRMALVIADDLRAALAAGPR